MKRICGAPFAKLHAALLVQAVAVLDRRGNNGDVAAAVRLVLHALPVPDSNK